MENSDKPQNIAKLEAFLFTHGEPIAIKKIAQFFKWEEKRCAEAIALFEERLKENGERGLAIARNADRIQLVSKPELHSIAQKIIEEEFREQLTPAALETLSLIAYLGPLPRMTIDYIRGVNSSFTLRNLLVRGLIERHPSGKGNIYHYQATFDFLKHVGLTAREQLPEYEKYKDILKQYEVQTNI